jgi:hypothetical protein
MQEIKIPLRPVGENDVGSADDYFAIIHDDYASRYLETIGVAATQPNKQMVMRNMPLKDCDIQASWSSRSSAVADSITILPPQRKKHTDIAAYETLNKLQKSQWYGIADTVHVAPPKTAARTINFKDEEGEEEEVAKGSAADLQKKMAAMASEGADADLQRELERVRSQRSGTDVKGAPVDELGEERRKRRERELELLKQKFILPFCCEHPAAEGGGTVLSSWHAPHLQGELKLEVPDLLRQEVLQAINVTLDEIKKELATFVQEYLPLELLTARRQEKQFFEELRGELGSTRIVRLAGLISHFLYWNILGYLHKERQLPETSKQSLFLTIHELWSSMQAHHKDNPLGVSFVIPVTMLTLKWTAERCFAMQYPKFMADNGLAQQLIDRVNVFFMRLFDPDCGFARFGAFDGTLKAIKLSRKLGLIQSQNGQNVTRRSLHKQHRATPLVCSVMSEGGCIDPKTRALMCRTTKAKKPTVAPSSPAHGKAPAPPPPAPVSARPPQKGQRMDEWKRVALFHVALSRLSPGFEDLASDDKGTSEEKVKLPAVGKHRPLGNRGAMSAR